MTTKYQQLHRRIAHYVPEVMELKFGCEIQPFNNIQRWPTPRFVSYVDDILTHEEGGKVGKSECSQGDIVSLGRPITLEDTLQAMGTYAHEESTRLNSSVPEVQMLKNGNELWPMWKRCYPLSAQSPETIDFLLSVIPDPTSGNIK